MGLAGGQRSLLPRRRRWRSVVPARLGLGVTVAAATQRPTIMTTFANNLFRSPVEFVQAALTMQSASGGRFVAGLGAGWNRTELETTGQHYPARRERADRYIEAAQIVRQLFDHRCCAFGGKHHTIDLPSMTGFEHVAPPPLVGSLGGPRTIASASAYLNGIELKGASPAFRDGDMDFGVLAAIPRDQLGELVDRVRRVREDIPLGFMAICGPSTDGMARAMEELFDADSLYGGFFARPKRSPRRCSGSPTRASAMCRSVRRRRTSSKRSRPVSSPIGDEHARCDTGPRLSHAPLGS